MALHYRKRRDIWHCRGSIRVGRRAIEVREFSTGARTRAEAETIGAAEENRIRTEIIDSGTAVEPPRRVTVGECITVYKTRPGGLHPLDVARLDELAADIGDVGLDEIRTAWGSWMRGRGAKLAPSTIARWRSTLRASLNYGAEEFGVAVPAIRAIKGADVERIAYLTPQQEARLLAAYSPWAAPVMLVLCETGMRTQEALRLDWRHVDFERGALLVEHAGRRGGPRTKTGKSRRVGMRPDVRAVLVGLWEDRGRPDSGDVFLSKRGRPYSDTRLIGGNPLAKAHRTACRKAGIERFRIHDWRHHFAVWFLMRGGNLRALCQIAGWSSMRMVARYAVFEQSDLDTIM